MPRVSSAVRGTSTNGVITEWGCTTVRPSRFIGPWGIQKRFIHPQESSLFPNPPPSSAIPRAWPQMETFAPALDVVNHHPYISLASGIFACIALVRSARWRSRPRLPPGPRGYPIVGNLFDLSPSYAWEQFSVWGKQYGRFSLLHPCAIYALARACAHRTFCTLGEITHISVLGQDMIILNSSKAAIDLLDKRSSIYSSRPILMMGGETVGWTRAMGLIQYGPRFREYRKLMGRLIGSRAAIERFAPLQEREMAKFVKRVMTDPGSLVHQIRK